MECGYYEEHVWPLTSSTSCYTGARGTQQTRKTSSLNNDSTDAIVVNVQWATQWHTCSVKIECDSQQKRLPLHSREVVPLDDDDDNTKSNMHCVGYSATTAWEALALLDISKVEAPNLQLQTPTPQQHLTTQSLTDDDASITASSSAAATTLGSHHLRSSSFISMSESAVDAFPLHSNNSAEMKSSINDEIIDMSAVSGEPSSEMVAQLILRQNNSTQEEYSTMLDFRPLAVTVTEFSSSDSDSIDNTDERSKAVGVWLGSADNNKLHWFVPSSQGNFRGGNERSLVPLTLVDPAFDFLTPVMAIAVATITADEPLYCLAVACQDGTIRLVTFRYQSDEGTVSGIVFQDIRHNQVIIDGPIVCLHLQETKRNERTAIHVTVGSLCGYVANVYLDPDTMEWQGPYMVAEGFWNARLNAEDSVLAVHTAGNIVWIGTQVGRLLVYSKRNDSNTTEPTGDSDEEESGDAYQFEWVCYLPYPVHAVSCLPDGRILVTTRRTVHLLRQSGRKVSTHAVVARGTTKPSSRLDQQLQQSVDSDQETHQLQETGAPPS